MSQFCACLAEDQINQKAEQIADAYIQQMISHGICPQAAMVALARTLRIIEVELADNGDRITAEEALKQAPLDVARKSLEKIDEAVYARAEPLIEDLRAGRVVVVGVNSKGSKKTH